MLWLVGKVNDSSSTMNSLWVQITWFVAVENMSIKTTYIWYRSDIYSTPLQTSGTELITMYYTGIIDPYMFPTNCFGRVPPSLWSREIPSYCILWNSVHIIWSWYRVSCAGGDYTNITADWIGRGRDKNANRTIIHYVNGGQYSNPPNYNIELLCFLAR